MRAAACNNGAGASESEAVCFLAVAGRRVLIGGRHPRRTLQAACDMLYIVSPTYTSW